jgi:hypothetical protein
MITYSDISSCFEIHKNDIFNLIDSYLSSQLIAFIELNLIQNSIVVSLNRSDSPNKDVDVLWMQTYKGKYMIILEFSDSAGTYSVICDNIDSIKRFVNAFVGDYVE